MCNAVAEVTECQPRPGADVNDIVGCSEQMPENEPGKVVGEVTECQLGPGADAEYMVCRPEQVRCQDQQGEGAPSYEGSEMLEEKVQCQDQKSINLSDRSCMHCRKMLRRLKNLKWDNKVWKMS